MAGLGDTVAALTALRRGGGFPSRSIVHSDAPRMKLETGFGSNPGGLGMFVHLPENLPPRAPLVVALHGCTQTAQDYAEGAGWLAVAERSGFAVLAPEQARANNANLCFNWFEPCDIARGGGEAASIRSMIDHLVARRGLDARRVFVTGLSAGAAMAAVMLAAYPEIFAGGALLAGLPYGVASGMGEAFGVMRGGPPRPDVALGDLVRAASAHAGPWPQVSVWHGDSDATVAPPVADAVARQWADVHGLRGAGRDEAADEFGRRRRVWSGEDGRTRVELHRIAGMGHGAPLHCAGADGCGRAGPFLLDVGLSSSLEIARAWGLAPRADVSRSLKADPAKPECDAHRSRPAPTVEKDGVGRVISEALEAAGLFRRR